MAKIKFEGSNWKINTTERSRGRMKLTIKLNKEESEGFKNWSELIKPDNITDDDFMKQIFFNGIEHLNDKLQKVSEQVMKDYEKQLQASGIPTSGTPVEPQQ